LQLENYRVSTNDALHIILRNPSAGRPSAKNTLRDRSNSVLYNQWKISYPSLIIGTKRILPCICSTFMKAKTLLLTGLGSALICLIATRASATSTLANGLDGYWTFDEGSGGVLHDSSGNGNNGTLVNYPGGQGVWTSGQTGGALQFSAASQEYVSVPNFAMPTTSMTLTAWVWADSLPQWATVAGNWNGNWGAFSYSTFESSPNMSLYVADGGSPPNIVNIDYGTSGGSISLNRWHFLAFVANSLTDTVTFMQDGSVSGSFHYNGQLLASSSELDLGGGAGLGNWDGKIDDMAIWTRALSSQELASIYNAGLAGQSLMTLIPEPSVVAVFNLGIFILAATGSRRVATGRQG
jgi:Concanavalin A-like lectin/glucanases superfamily